METEDPEWKEELLNSSDIQNTDEYLSVVLHAFMLELGFINKVIICKRRIPKLIFFIVKLKSGSKTGKEPAKPPLRGELLKKPPTLISSLPLHSTLISPDFREHRDLRVTPVEDGVFSLNHLYRKIWKKRIID